MTVYKKPVEFEADLMNRFSYHKPIDDQDYRYKEIRNAALTFAELLGDYCPASRELSLALTKLEEAVFWGNASIARNEKENN